MTLNLFRRPNPAPARRPRTSRHSFTLEGLEDRVVMSHAAVVPAAMPAVHVAASSHNTVSVPIHITSVKLTAVTTNAKGFITSATGTVTGTIDGIAFKPTKLTIAPGMVSQAAAASHPGVKSAAVTPAVPVLALHLAPIDLNLLGLEVKTSDICLNISAQPGPGNLLGNLVGGLANALNGVTTPATGSTGLLSRLNKQFAPATAGGSPNLLGVMNSALTKGLGSTTPARTAAATPTVDNLVHLTLGPLNLNLLGLVVKLDNCSGGPVTVDVNAISGPGDLLGNLLTGVAHLLDGSGKGVGLLSRLDTQILGLIKNL